MDKEKPKTETVKSSLSPVEKNPRVSAAVDEYIANNREHSESTEQLYSVFYRLFEFFDAFGEQNGTGKLYAFLAILLEFTDEELDTVWPELLQIFYRDRDFVLAFDPIQSNLKGF